MGPFGEKVINYNGDKLIDICEQNSLIILNGYFKHKMIHQYTWHEDTQELRSIIDPARCESFGSCTPSTSFTLVTLSWGVMQRIIF